MVNANLASLPDEHLGLLDDDDFNISLFRTTAAMCGIRRISIYRNSAAAIAALGSPVVPSIMCVHWKNPLAVGLDFCRAIRNRATSPTPFLPIVMISEYATHEHVVAARDAGIDEFLASPFSAKTFRERILSVSNSRRGFVDVDGFFGPDRRRGSIAEMLREDRRSEPAELVDPSTGELYVD